VADDQRLAVGDVCIGQNFTHSSHRNGMECEVIEQEGWGWATHERSGATEYVFGYRVKWADGAFARQDRKYLRKKRPPPQREQTSTWDDVIVWRPRETVAS
jgi:hypothetical protein